MFANLLLQVDVTSGKVLRVVEVPGTRPQFTHLVADAFQYDSEFDLFLVGSVLLANPFRALIQNAMLVSPVHEQRCELRWEQRFCAVTQPHPKATILHNLVPAVSGHRSLIPFARMFQWGGEKLGILTMTQESLLFCSWLRGYHVFHANPGFTWFYKKFYVPAERYRWSSVQYLERTRDIKETFLFDLGRIENPSIPTLPLGRVTVRDLLGVRLSIKIFKN